MVEQFRKYLRNFGRHFQYSTISIISDKRKKYYTNLGFNEVMNLENDPHDIWYKLFLDLKEHGLKIYFINDKGNVVLGADTSNIKIYYSQKKNAKKASISS